MLISGGDEGYAGGSLNLPMRGGANYDFFERNTIAPIAAYKQLSTTVFTFYIYLLPGRSCSIGGIYHSIQYIFFLSFLDDPFRETEFSLDFCYSSVTFVIN